MKPYINDTDFRLYVGDVRQVLAELPAESVDCCVTSPPYWGLRDYGTDGQIGLEATPELFVAEMVGVFRQVRRVLAPLGTLWLNLGDSYSHGGNGSRDAEKWPKQSRNDHRVEHRNTAGGKPKDLVGIPWRVAFALQADGWYLRADIIWSKPNPMPESVTDRPTKAHEYVFLLSKQPRYFFDQEAVREAWTTTHAPGSKVNETQHYGAGNGGNSGLTAHLADVKARLRVEPQDETLDGSDGEAPRGPDGRRATNVKGADGSIQHRDGERWPNGGRNIRSVWDIATQPYPDAHFATFPEALPERCIKAGCPVRVCVTCGKASERITERGETMEVERGSARLVPSENGRSSRKVGQAYQDWLNANPAETVGFTDCGHDNWRTGTVIDPFMGSGTTALVARRHGRHAIGVELNPEYAELCARRTRQLSLLADAA